MWKLKMIKRVMDWLYKDMVYSVSKNCWFYKEGGHGEWVD